MGLTGIKFDNDLRQLQVHSSNNNSDRPKSRVQADVVSLVGFKAPAQAIWLMR